MPEDEVPTTEEATLTADETAVEDEEAVSEPASANCQHCGEPSEVDVSETPDWLCPHCERYQDSMTCPTCKQPTRASLMPEDLRPAAHAPKRHRKSKEN